MPAKGRRAVTVRHANLSDLEQIAVLDKATHEAEATTIFSFRQSMDLGHMFIVAQTSGKTVGYAQGAVAEGGKTGWILNMVVNRTIRRQGIGRRLLKELLSTFKGRGVEEVLLTVSPKNKPALELYLSSGFALHKFENDYFGRGANRIVMLLSLRKD
jgi:ribosomal protein S18 acetylase RimI-like enzyme